MRPEDDVKLRELRATMDRLNVELRDLVQRRARLSREIRARKEALDLPVHDAEREQDQVDAWREKPGDGMSPDALERVLRRILEECRDA